MMMMMRIKILIYLIWYVVLYLNKKRFMEDGFDLDLTYITNQIIAMGFPAEGLAGQYRNNMSDVQKLFNTKHKDHYKIYNLCSELSYDHKKFDNHVIRYGFNDHNPSPFNMIFDIVQDIHKWLDIDSLHVAAIHCKAGKGRTGFIISNYLLYNKLCTTAPQALDYFATKRTYDGAGVTIPSQKG